MHIFAQKLVSGTSKQVPRNSGPLWQPGVCNDTNSCSLLAQEDPHKTTTHKNCAFAVQSIRKEPFLQQFCLQKPALCKQLFYFQKFQRKLRASIGQGHQTNAPTNKAKNVQKISENCVSSASGQFLDIFRTFFRHFRTFCLRGYFNFLRLFLETLQQCPLKQA